MNLLCYCWSCWWRKLWTQTEEAKNLYILAYSERWSYPRSRFHRPYQQNRDEMMIKMVAITFKNRFDAFQAHCPSSQFQKKKKKKIQIGSNFFKNVWSGFSLLIIHTGQLLARWSSTKQSAVASWRILTLIDDFTTHSFHLYIFQTGLSTHVK